MTSFAVDDRGNRPAIVALTENLRLRDVADFAPGTSLDVVLGALNRLAQNRPCYAAELALALSEAPDALEAADETADQDSWETLNLGCAPVQVSAAVLAAFDAPADHPSGLLSFASDLGRALDVAADPAGKAAVRAAVRDLFTPFDGVPVLVRIQDYKNNSDSVLFLANPQAAEADSELLTEILEDGNAIDLAWPVWDQVMTPYLQDFHASDGRVSFRVHPELFKAWLAHLGGRPALTAPAP